MPFTRSAACPILVEDVSEFEVRNGFVYCSVGGAVFAAPVHVYEAGMLLAKDAIADWRGGRACEIIQLPRH